VQLGEQTDDPGGIEVGQLLLGDVSVGCTPKGLNKKYVEFNGICMTYARVSMMGTESWPRRQILLHTTIDTG
jgi:hypothetical protein